MVRKRAKVGSHDRSLGERTKAELLSYIADLRAEYEREVTIAREELDVYIAETRAQSAELEQGKRLLEESRDAYANLYEFAPVGYALLDAKGCIREINLRGSELLGSERSPLIGSPLVASIARSSQRSVLEHLRRSRSESDQVITEVDVDHRSSQPLRLRLVSRRVDVDLERGEPLIRTALIDVTDEWHAELQIKRANSDLLKTTEQLQQTTALLRQLALALTQAEEKERRRLAQVLHDHLQQLLFAAQLRVRSLQLPAGTSTVVSEIASMLDQGVQTCRTLAAELSPAALYEQGLIAALHWLAGQMREKHGLSVAIAAPERLLMNEDIGVALYQAAREALFNVVKHSGAQHAQLTVRSAAGLIRLMVRDAGRGFDVSQLSTRRSAGLGLPGISERVRALGGTLEIESSTEPTQRRGTCVMVLLPAGRSRRTSSRPPPTSARGNAPHSDAEAPDRTGLHKARRVADGSRSRRPSPVVDGHARYPKADGHVSRQGAEGPGSNPETGVVEPNAITSSSGALPVTERGTAEPTARGAKGSPLPRSLKS